MEDGVDIYLSEVSSSEIDLESHDALEGSANPLATPIDTCSDINPMQSFTFEAQVNNLGFFFFSPSALTKCFFFPLLVIYSSIPWHNSLVSQVARHLPST